MQASRSDEKLGSLLGTTTRKSTAFPADVSRLSPPPAFLRREPGDEARQSPGNDDEVTILSFST